jgi:hypothetical protein
VGELVGADADSERAIRYLIALMVVLESARDGAEGRSFGTVAA